jgi:hypothetical protein
VDRTSFASTWHGHLTPSPARFATFRGLPLEAEHTPGRKRRFRTFAPTTSS